MASDIILNDDDIAISGSNVTFDRGAQSNPVALNLKNINGFWQISGPRSFEPNEPLSIYWHDNSKFSEPLVTLTNQGNVGIGSNNPVRKIHVAGSEIHSDGPSGGFSFSDRNQTGHIDLPANGERWVWYAQEGKARLWSGRDVLIIANDDVGVRVEGNLLVTGALDQASSIALKENVAKLSGQEAMIALQGLNAVKYTDKADSQKELQLGFIAEEVPDLVAHSERDRLSPMALIAVLTTAMQEMQKNITTLISEVNTLKQQARGP